MRNQILQGDSRELIKTLPSESIDCLITSPPYLWLRDYGIDGQIGLEKSMQEYLETMWGLFDEVKRILKKTGTVWVNLGDTYSGNMRFTTKYANKEQWHPDKPIDRPSGLQPKTLVAIPDRFKIGMIDRGWKCRNEIIWYKRNAMPSSAKDRFTVDYEKIFFFTKSQKYYFETQYEPYDSIKGIEKTTENAKKMGWNPDKMSYEEWYNNAREKQGFYGDAKVEGVGLGGMTKATGKDKPWLLKPMPKFGGNKAEGYGNPTYSGNEWQPSFGRLKRTVWDIPTQPYSEAHFATYPEELVQTCIKAGCPDYVCTKCGKPREPIWEPTEEYKKLLGKGWHDHSDDTTQGQMQEKEIPSVKVEQYRKTGLSDCGCNAGFETGIVLDPFFGSGTTGVAARKLARDFIGFELNPEYIQLAQKRLAPLMQQARLI